MYCFIINELNNNNINKLYLYIHPIHLSEGDLGSTSLNLNPAYHHVNSKVSQLMCAIKSSLSSVLLLY